MSEMTMNKLTYVNLIQEDIDELDKYMPEHSIIRKHINDVLNWSIDKIYPENKDIKTTKISTIPRPLSYVIFDRNSCSDDVYEEYYKEKFGSRLYIFLGEVPQCPGHCILADLKNSNIIGIYHTDNFREATEDEL